jgi:soluble lytic murein transglycosylase-like protein
MKKLLATLMATLCLSSSVQAVEITIQDRVSQFIENTYKISYAYDIVDKVFSIAEKKNLDPLFILAMMQVESGFNANAKSPANSHGLMQVHYPSHRKKVIEKNDLYDLDTNIELGTEIWKECVDKSKTIYAAAMCYTGGHHDWLGKVRLAHNNLNKLHKEPYETISANKRSIPTRVSSTKRIVKSQG